MIKQQIDQDLKAALLSGNTSLTSVLRSLKSAILYEEVAKGMREHGLDETAIIGVLAREAKKRQESVDMYRKGGDPGRAEVEAGEKRIIEEYLPPSLSEAALTNIVEEVITKLGAVNQQDMGKVIAVVRTRTVGVADGATIARLVRERLH